MGAIQLNKVEKWFGDLQVIKGIDLDIQDGEFVIFVGPSGCGKSTLLRLISGLEETSRGSIEIDSKDVTALPPSGRGLSMVFQSYALYPHMSVRENVGFGLKTAGVPKPEIENKVNAAAEVLKLDDYLDRRPKALSGGQRQRVAIGRAIVREPSAFLFDEPLSNLDAALRVATRIEIAQLKESMPESTMIYVTHDQVEAMTLASRIVVLHGGDIEQVGAPLELYERPANTFVAQFIGSPAMNLLDAEVMATGGQTEVRISGGGHAVTHIPSTEADTGSTVKFGVRPEDLSLTDSDDYLVEAEVKIVEALGETTVLYFEKDDLIAKLPGIQAIEKGRKVRLTAPANKMHLFDASGNSLLYR